MSLYILLFASCFAQQLQTRSPVEKYRAIHWDIDQGLSQGETYCMLKDAEGFLWIGTRIGLNRFDGSTFKAYFYDPANPTSIQNNNTTQGLVEDSLHNLWIGAGRGLSRYNRKEDTFTNILPDSTVLDDWSWSNIPFWATKDEVWCLESKTNIAAYNIRSLKKRVLANIKPYGFGFNGLPFCYSSVEAASNSIWMLAHEPENPNTGLLQVSLKDGSKQFFTWPCFLNIPNHIHWTEAMKYDSRRASIWLNTPDGLLEFTLKDKQFHPVEAINKLTQSKDYGRWTGIDLDLQGRVWFATKKGILVYDPATQNLIKPFADDSSLSKQVSENNARIFCDKDGIMWSGFWAPKGFYQFVPFSPAVTRYIADKSKPQSLSSNAVWTIAKGDNGTMWMGTDNGLNIFDPLNGTFKILPVKDSTGLVRKRALFPVLVDTLLKKAWVGADGSHAFELFEIDLPNKKSSQVLFRDTLNHSIPLVEVDIPIIPYKHGCVVPGIYGNDKSLGIFIINSDSAVGREILHLPKNAGYLAGLCSDDDLIFINRPGYVTNLTYRYLKEKWVQINTPLDSIKYYWLRYNLNDQTYWVVAEQQLIHYNRNLKVIYNYTVRDGLPDLAIYDGITDNNNNFWFHTDRALYCLKVQTGKIIALSERDGFQKQNFAPGVYAAKDDLGNLYFPGGVFGSGFDRINPDNLIENYPPSFIYIRSLEINQELFSESSAYNRLQKLSLAYFQNKISIETGTIDYFSQGKSNIRYKLGGVNENWQYAPAFYTIRYDGLPPGKYTLRLQASNLAGDFKGPVKSLLIVIAPPFWKTWWFRILAVVFAASLMYVLIRWRLHQKFHIQLQKSEKEKQLAELQHKTTELEMQVLQTQMDQFQKLQQMRMQIASDLHDDIGSTLTSISYYSELVKMRLKEDDASLEPFINKIGASARNMVSAMSDIVWVVNPENDTTFDLVSHMKKHAAEMLAARNITYGINVNEETEKVKFNLQERKNLYLIYKEALNNAIKYAQCSEIKIDFLQADHQIALQIKDNGRGFNVKLADSGNGLQNMQKRAEEIHGKFEIKSDKETGTCISVTCKIT